MADLRRAGAEAERSGTARSREVEAGLDAVRAANRQLQAELQVGGVDRKEG